MSLLTNSQPARTADSDYQWTLGFALTARSIPAYAEYYDSPFGSFASDERNPTLKTVHQWTEALAWMANNLTKICHGNRIQLLWCYPRAPHPSSEPATTSDTPIPSYATPSKSSDTPNTSQAIQDVGSALDSLYVIVVSVAGHGFPADSLLHALQVLLDRRGREGSFPLEGCWEKLVDHLGIEGPVPIPRLYQIWDPDVGMAPHVSEENIRAWLRQQNICSDDAGM